MKRKPSKSKFDLLVDKLVEEFVKIPNFDLVSTDSLANRAFNMISFRIAEVTSYNELVCQHFIPATNKAIFLSKQDFLNSKYKSLLNLKAGDFNETLYDTVRLAYVGLFHKIENFVNDLADLAENIFEDAELVKTQSLMQWAKSEYNFDFKDWRRFDIVFKINWICNCVKHRDGFPTRQPKPIFFSAVDETKRLRISPSEFKQDCEILLEFYPVYVQVMFAFASLKYAWDTTAPQNTTDFPELQEFYVKQREELKVKAREFVNKLENLRLEHQIL